MTALMILMAIVCYVVGFARLGTAAERAGMARMPPPPLAPPRVAGRTPGSGRRDGGRRVEALNCPKCGGTIGEADRKCPYCGSALSVASPESLAAPGLLKLDWIHVGDGITVVHPAHGALAVHVAGRVVYEELWQRTRGGPWVPTGNAFAGFWLDDRYYLLNCLSRYYLLDERKRTHDGEVRQRFAPYAKRFGESDQTATVQFEYPPGAGTQWQIEDIGKLRVRGVEGHGFEWLPGAVFRFLHAGGSGRRALVVEDYESGGGGQDTVWQGYQAEESAVRQA